MNLETVPMDGDPYPGCPNAIRWLDQVFLECPDGPIRMREIGSIERVMDGLKYATESAVGFAPENRALAEAALPEYDHPDFRRWLLARVYGAM